MERGGETAEFESELALHTQTGAGRLADARRPQTAQILVANLIHHVLIEQLIGLTVPALHAD
jgi:hypothetical protein